MNARYVISALVSDRVGILRDITGAVTDLGGNIDGISQTVVAGYFTVILTATFDANLDRAAIAGALEAQLPAREASFLVRTFEAPESSGPVSDGDRYIVTISGNTRHATLKAVTTYLADAGVNVEDWAVYFEKDSVTHIGEITVPRLRDLKQLQDGLRRLLDRLGLNGSIQHENIFRVTSEVGSVRPLLLGKDHV